ncbi:class I SAM-dependent methyltransferase [Janthinobacterium agaricidamnosum]|uniref:Methyltransferase domain protein n=1 Tax=Janthinobacterium agaricidamnosum NBRC 102515 = DSM 9628 TaxID=1349767 RepID=W0V3U1_9BURK|nr:class I SAM-dependent methyltransferase [Janthinobacterium agaricidamnosum]CDG82285.1 methyltransferase domain protein [Janthinobacterium agaricidamnosum NBRC 102515 = DSM 9628]
MNWTDGYASDTDYQAGFFREQSPVYLSFACALNGVEPIDTGRPYTYFELGFGRGLTANLLAASNPHGQFFAADFNPAYVAGARQLAGQAALDNLTLLEASFADLADGKHSALPPCDFISLNGVYTWVSEENRRQIVRFIERYLKPGGIVYISYNAMPGWASALPLQRLLVDHAELRAGGTGTKVDRARAFCRQLEQVKAGYFDANPGLSRPLDALQRESSDYLAHEYMHRCWQPLYHKDVAHDLAGAKLDYAGSAHLPHAFPSLAFTPEQQQLLDAVDDHTLRETIKDYLLNTSYRQDIFVRGARRMKPLRQAEWLLRSGLALTVRRADVKPHDAADAPLFDALALRPHTLAELAALSGRELAGMARTAAVLIASGQVCPYIFSGAGVPPAAAQRLNQAIARHSTIDDDYQGLASPLLGNGVAAGLVQRLVYLALCAEPAGPGAPDAAAIVRQVAAGLRGHSTIDQAQLADTVQAILRERLPIWRQLQVL